VQFVELFVPPGNNFETVFQGQTLNSNSRTFTFPNNPNITVPTGGKSVLIATPGFAALPGAVAPDFTLPSGNFFSTMADSVRFPVNSDPATNKITFAAGQLPTDGRMSINRSLTSALNSPKNFAGQMGSLSPVTPGDINGDGDVDRNDVAIVATNFGLTAASAAQGDLSGDMKVGLADLARVQMNLDPAAANAVSAVPEPGTLGLAISLAAAGLIAVYRRTARRQLQSGA
jgi:hypothetical protein